MLLGVLEIRAGVVLGGLGCFWDGMMIGRDFEAGDQKVINCEDLPNEDMVLQASQLSTPVSTKDLS